MKQSRSNNSKTSPKKLASGKKDALKPAQRSPNQRRTPSSISDGPKPDEGTEEVAPDTPALSIDKINPHVRMAEYAVRGRLLARAEEIEAQLRAGEPFPFTRTVKCNIGNPQALGQRPITFARQTLSLIVNPELLDISGQLGYPSDVIDRARLFIEAVPSVGAYSDSQGIQLVRQHVAEFITARDGYPASPKDIFLTDGASAGVRALMQLLIRGPQDAVLCPVPQYPLYSATTAMLNGSLAGYYLDESMSWGVHLNELRRAHAESKKNGATPRALVVINPGNPTGQCLPKEAVMAILRFAATEGMALMADEVYQENVYGAAPKFTSFKSAYCELRAAAEAGDAEAAVLATRAQLISFHSTSKGFFGECGLRGGYFELCAQRAQMHTHAHSRYARPERPLTSLCLCSSAGKTCQTTCARTSRSSSRSACAPTSSASLRPVSWSNRRLLETHPVRATRTRKQPSSILFSLARSALRGSSMSCQASRAMLPKAQCTCFRLCSYRTVRDARHPSTAMGKRPL